MKKLLYGWTLLMLLVLSVHDLSAQRIAVSGNEFVVDGQRIWLNGANTPWDNWNDFGGNFDYSWWNEHFQVLKDANVNSTRVWITCDGEVGINIDDSGYVSGATDAFYRHVDQLMQIAQDKGIYLMVALISFDHVRNNHGNYYQWRTMMNASRGRQSLVDNFVKPFVDRYRDNPYFFAIDVSNEIDWMFEEHEVSIEATQDLVARVANAVHSRSEILVCQGLGTGLKYLSPNYETALYGGHYYSDAALGAQQSGAYLDFYNVHYYGWQNEFFGNPYRTSPAAYKIDDKPCIIGESPASGTTGYSPLACTQEAFNQGWQGYMPWTSNGVDDERTGNGDITDLDDGSRWFYANYPDLVYPRGEGGDKPPTDPTDPPVADGSLLIYQDQLADGWQNWSWAADTDFAERGTVQSGSQAVAVTYTEGYGGFSLRTANSISTAGYQALELEVHGGSGDNLSLKVYTQTDDEGGNSLPVTITATGGSWQRITIALSELGSPSTVQRITVQSNTATPPPTIYLDRIRLVGESPTSVANRSPASSPAVVAYPNRLRDEPLQLRWAAGLPEDTFLEIVDLTGRRVFRSQDRPTSVARNRFAHSGGYVVRMINHQGSESYRIVVE